MRVQNQINNNYTFKGYDARVLKGFLMDHHLDGITSEMSKIAEKEGFKLFYPTYNSETQSFKIVKYSEQIKFGDIYCWSQDFWTILKNKILFDYEPDYLTDVIRITKAIKKSLRLKSDTIQKERAKSSKLKHIQGGNIFIVKNGDNEEVLVGKEELVDFKVKEIKSMYNVKKVISLPQMDFHLDLFVRPLDNKRILLADDNLSLEVLNTMQRNLHKYIEKQDKSKLNKEEIQEICNIEARLKNYADYYKDNILKNKYQHFSKVEEILNRNGYEVIKVPGRLYEYRECDSLIHDCNYINANVIKNKKGELVYITNKSTLGEKFLRLTPKIQEAIGGGFEDYFIRSLSPYVNPEHIYFVSGKNNAIEGYLKELGGGIHCLCTEVP